MAQANRRIVQTMLGATTLGVTALMVACSASGTNLGATASPKPAVAGKDVVSQSDAAAAFATYRNASGANAISLEGAPLHAADAADLLIITSKPPQPPAPLAPPGQTTVLVPHQAGYPAYFLGLLTRPITTGTDTGKSETTIWIFTQVAAGGLWQATFQAVFDVGVPAPAFDVDQSGFAKTLTADELHTNYRIDESTLSGNFAVFASDTVNSGVPHAALSDFALSPSLNALLSGDRHATHAKFLSQGLQNDVSWASGLSDGSRIYQPAFKLKDHRAFVPFVNTESDHVTAPRGPRESITVGTGGDGIQEPKAGKYTDIMYLRTFLGVALVSASGTSEVPAYYYITSSMVATPCFFNSC